MSHELFRVASASPGQLDLAVAGIAFLLIAGAALGAYAHWANKRRRSSTDPVGAASRRERRGRRKGRA